MAPTGRNAVAGIAQARGRDGYVRPEWSPGSADLTTSRGRPRGRDRTAFSGAWRSTLTHAIDSHRRREPVSVLGPRCGLMAFDHS
jgi:hypothetical protein